MKIRLVAVGRPKRSPMEEQAGVYLERCQRYFTTEAVWVRDHPQPGRQPEVARVVEGEGILQKLNPATRVVVLDEGGVAWTSQEFASFLERCGGNGVGEVAFVIGGPYGLSPAVKARADVVLRLSSFTLPHAMARLVLSEQLYRAGTLTRGEPYHNP